MMVPDFGGKARNFKDLGLFVFIMCPLLDVAPEGEGKVLYSSEGSNTSACH
jgi:hypothetical protein